MAIAFADELFEGFSLGAPRRATIAAQFLQIGERACPGVCVQYGSRSWIFHSVIGSQTNVINDR